jgi:hypothetical protein
MPFDGCRRHRAALLIAAGMLSALCEFLWPGSPASADDVQTTNGTRQEIRLPQADSDALRTEMRTLLRSLGLIVQGLVRNDLVMIERAARASGAAAALNSETAKRLPPPFVQLDTRLHQRFDQMADAAKTGKSQDLLKRLAALTGYCVACHDSYRLEVRQ